jgi:hypothetical protein
MTGARGHLVPAPRAVADAVHQQEVMLPFPVTLHGRLCSAPLRLVGSGRLAHNITKIGGGTEEEVKHPCLVTRCHRKKNHASGCLSGL